MSRSRCLFVAALILALASFASAQTTTKPATAKEMDHSEHAEHAAAGKLGAKLEKATLQQVWDAWSTLKVAKDLIPALPTAFCRLRSV